MRLNPTNRLTPGVFPAPRIVVPYTLHSVVERPTADAEWLAELLEHGLLRGSFVPPVAIREMRDLTRYRKRLIQSHTSECQRIQKTLEDAGIKLDSVASDVLGMSGRAMLAALVADERDGGAASAGSRTRASQGLPVRIRRRSEVHVRSRN